MIAPTDISLWMEQAEPGDPSAPLNQDLSVDVAIAGAGYTGLWTAYYLKLLAPELNIAVLEARRCGFGASGRNGGWMMAAFEGDARMLAGLDQPLREQTASLIHGILPEVEQVLAREDMHCDYHRGGGLFAAGRYPEQGRRMRTAMSEYQAIGQGDPHHCWLDAQQLSQRLNIAGALGGIYTPHIARIQPAKLVLELARVLRDKGVRIYEQTPVTSLEPGAMRCGAHRVEAGHRLLALEGYSTGLPLMQRRVLAVQSRIIATEPLDEALWAQIGLADREVFCDASPLTTYGQRSADNRMVFGARGSYRFGGKPRSEFTADDPGFAAVHRLLLACFPQLQDIPITHRWGGTLGAPRSGFPHAVYHAESGVGTAGGYYGEGVGASNLMARTLADLVLARDSELTQAPWAHRGTVQASLRRWEPEPLRWLGYRATDWVGALEERVYLRESPAWQKRPVQWLAGALERLRQ